MAGIDIDSQAKLARHASGLIVPEALANSQPVPGKHGIARDMDGRRRVVYTNDERRKLDQAIVLLKAQGMGVILGCLGAYTAPGAEADGLTGGWHFDGSKACGQPMKAEDAGGPDPGYGCNCTRIHFLRRFR